MKNQAIIAFTLMFLLTSCASTTDPYTGEAKRTNATKGAIWGAVIGAATGALTNTSDGKRTAENALAGAVAGAAVGAGVGAYMDRQEKEIRDQLRNSGVSVVRNGNDIRLVMPSSITFAHDKSNIKSDFYPVLSAVAKVLIKFNKTLINVAGHTDSTGKESYNQALSYKRAGNVVSYLTSQRVSSARLNIQAYGQSRPVADNNTASGRAQNRRVEITIVPKN